MKHLIGIRVVTLLMSFQATGQTTVEKSVRLYEEGQDKAATDLLLPGRGKTFRSYMGMACTT